MLFRGMAGWDDPLNAGSERSAFDFHDVRPSRGFALFFIVRILLVER